MTGDDPRSLRGRGRTLAGLELSLGDEISQLLSSEPLTGDLATGFDWTFRFGVDLAALPSTAEPPAAVGCADAMWR